MDTNENEGLWGHIVSLAPRVEIEELRSIIGSHLIEKTVTLWDELKAFSSILTDIQTLEFDLPASVDSDKKGYMSNDGTMRKVSNEASDSQNVPCLDLSNADNGVLDSTKLVGADSNPNNKKNNNNNNDDDEFNLGKTTDRSNMSMDSFDFIRSIEDSICVSRIHEVVEQIRNAFQQEQEELESEINILYNAMDTESDLIASSSQSIPKEGQRRKDIDCSASNHDNRQIMSATGSPKMFKTKDTSSSGNSKFVKMQRFVSPEHHPGRIRPRKSKCNHEDEEMNMKMEMDAKAEGEETKPKSKVRNKLQAARDEKHFLDI